MQRNGTDRDLIRDYVSRRDHAAFGELVARHADMVYAAALRQTGRRDLAEEITQAVFILLARKADRLADAVILPAWLHKATRYTALNAIKLENRRRTHERRAAAMVSTSQRDSTPFSRLAPDLDEGIAALPDKDRQAVILRFLQQQSFNQVANALGVSESAAQMRVTRALERLRLFFRRRGIEISATALGGAVRVNAAPPAPLHFGQAIALRAVLPADDIPVRASHLASETSRSMTLETLRSTLLIAVAAIVLIAGSLLVGSMAMQHPHHWQPATASEPAARGEHDWPRSVAVLIGRSS